MIPNGSELDHQLDSLNVTYDLVVLPFRIVQDFDGDSIGEADFREEILLPLNVHQ